MYLHKVILASTNEKPLGVIIMLHNRLIKRAGYMELLLNALAPRIEAEFNCVVEGKFSQLEESCIV